MESGSHDGSAKSATIVNVPSVDSLLMNLSLLGFENIDVVADPETYRSSVWQDKRPLSGVCITATVSQQPDFMVKEESEWIDEYEKGLERESLPRTLVGPLYRSLVLNDSSVALVGNLKQIHEYVLSNGEKSGAVKNLLAAPHNGKYAVEIVQNWRYSPCDKISLEYGKLLKSEGKFDEALNVLKGVTSKLNADWRSVYRSFHLISRIYRELGKKTEADKYKELCLKCNYKYPVDL